MVHSSRHGGNLYEASQLSGMPPESLLDFSANINPLGFPEWLPELITEQIDIIRHYPDPLAVKFTTELAALHQVSPQQITVGNGASELLFLLPRVLQKKRLLVPVPSYTDYIAAGQSAGLPVELLPLQAAENFRLDLDRLAEKLTEEHLVMLGHPNNPTGQLCEENALREVIRAHPQCAFIVDESFIDFCPGDRSMRYNRPANLSIVHSMTKFWAIPGLRLGYMLAEPDLINRLNRQRPFWSVNSLAQMVGQRALNDVRFPEQSREAVGRFRRDLKQRLTNITGLTPISGSANYILTRIDDPRTDAARLNGKLLKKGIMIRNCDNFPGLNNRYIRLAVRTIGEQQRLCSALSECLEIPVKQCKTDTRED